MSEISALPIAEKTAIAPGEDDPAFKAAEHFRQASAAWFDAATELDAAEGKLFPNTRPCPLVSWRTYGAIGGREIDDARAEFLGDPTLNKKLIDREYKQTKRKERQLIRAGADWDRANGLSGLRARVQAAAQEMKDSGSALAVAEPKTAVGCAALVSVIRAELELDGESEQAKLLLATVSRFLDRSVEPAPTG